MRQNYVTDRIINWGDGPTVIGSSTGLTLGIDTADTTGGLTDTGVISVNHGLYILGSGTLLLAGTPTYKGGTVVSSGTLEADHLTGSLSIAAGATAVLTPSGGHNLNASVLSSLTFDTDGNWIPGQVRLIWRGALMEPHVLLDRRAAPGAAAVSWRAVAREGRGRHVVPEIPDRSA
jgi:autotransporter-associated beta strand protein